MKAFTQHTGLVCPLDRANVDTDQIIPKQFLKSIKSFCPILEHRNKRRTRVPLKLSLSLLIYGKAKLSRSRKLLLKSSLLREFSFKLITSPALQI